MTDLALASNWYLGWALGNRTATMLRSRTVRRIGLRAISGKPGDVPAEVAIRGAEVTIANDAFPQHFRKTRRSRFTGGRELELPIKVIWGDKERIALAGKSQFLDELPPQTSVEIWHGCGHMLMWDAPERLVREIREFFPS